MSGRVVSGRVVSGRVVSGREVGGLESVPSGRFSTVVVVARLVRLVVAPTGDPTDTRATPTATTVAVASVVHRVVVMLLVFPSAVGDLPLLVLRHSTTQSVRKPGVRITKMIRTHQPPCSNYATVAVKLQAMRTPLDCEIRKSDAGRAAEVLAESISLGC